MIDLHCHPLPGIDDRPASTKEALAMLRIEPLEAVGLGDLVATLCAGGEPHEMTPSRAIATTVL